jgi:NitT/TauT family transport system ATP-binding protein
VPIVAPISLGLGGNAITVSQALWHAMCAHGADLGASPQTQGEALRAVVRARERDGKEPLTFAMVYPFSAHNYELRYWLAACGIDPDRQVRLIVMPPPLLVDAMREGQIDGFCVGEPWNSLAVSVGAGTIVLPTTHIWRMSPEKVLGCRLEWAQRHPEQLSALVRAIYKSARWCELPENHVELARMLAQLRYVGAPADILLRGLANRLVLLQGAAPREIADFYVTSRQLATFPWVSHALWFYSQMVRWRQVEYSDQDAALVRATYRPDLYRLALGSLAAAPVADNKIEGTHSAARMLETNSGTVPYGPDGFFDGRVFDPGAVRGYAEDRE